MAKVMIDIHGNIVFTLEPVIYTHKLVGGDLSDSADPQWSTEVSTGM